MDISHRQLEKQPVTIPRQTIKERSLQQTNKEYTITKEKSLHANSYDYNVRGKCENEDLKRSPSGIAHPLYSPYRNLSPSAPPDHCLIPACFKGYRNGMVIILRKMVEILI